MNCYNILYKIQEATEKNIREHLYLCANNFNPPLSSFVDIDLYSQKISMHAITFEAWESGQLIGLIAAYYNNETDKTGWITNVSVVKEFSGIGIATKLLKLAIDYGKVKGFNSVELEVHKNNTAAINLYLKHGFLQSKISAIRYNVKVFKLLF